MEKLLARLYQCRSRSKLLPEFFSGLSDHLFFPEAFDEVLGEDRGAVQGAQYGSHNGAIRVGISSGVDDIIEGFDAERVAQEEGVAEGERVVDVTRSLAEHFHDFFIPEGCDGGFSEYIQS